MKASFIICVSGFTQSRGYFHGILKLRESLIINGMADGPRRRVWYLTWKSNFDRVAADLAIICTQHGYKPVVMIAGYSYGGWGALQLARALERKGIAVESMALSDPVGRPWWWPRPLPAMTSMISRRYAFKLKVPPNVHKCHTYYQTRNRPQGHQVVPTNGTEMTHPIRLNYTHQRMDDASEFHGRVLSEAKLLNIDGESQCENNLQE